MVVKNSLQELEKRREAIRWDPYIMDIDKRRNCYNCKYFGYFARYYRN